VLVGSRLCDPKYEGGPAWEFSCPRLKMLAGLDDEADCEFSCEKCRVEVACRTAASGAVREANGRDPRSKLEAAEATSLLRDAIVEVEANEWVVTDTRSSMEVARRSATAAVNAPT